MLANKRTGQAQGGEEGEQASPEALKQNFSAAVLICLSSG